MKNTVIKSVFVLALACSGASCTGNYLEINSNPYEVTEEEMQRKGYAISSYLNAIFGTIISPDVNTTQFTDALLGGTQGGYFADSQNGWKTTISNYNPTNDWTRVFMYSDRIIPVLYSNLMKLNGISEDPIVLSIAKIAKVCAMNRVTDAYGPIPYSEIGISGKIQVPYDTQADVYRQMFDELDEAIEMLTAHSSEAITASTRPGLRRQCREVVQIRQLDETAPGDACRLHRLHQFEGQDAPAVGLRRPSATRSAFSRRTATTPNCPPSPSARTATRCGPPVCITSRRGRIRAATPTRQPTSSAT